VGSRPQLRRQDVPAVPAGLQAEAQALRQWRSGDPAGFERLYALASPRLRSFCRLLERDEASASDLFQETWRQALARVDQYRIERSFRAWLVAIARNLRVDQQRRLGVSRRVVEERARDLREAVPSGVARILEVRESLLRLPDEEREAVVLYDMQGLSLGETADVLDVSISTVRTRLAKAHEALKKTLQIT
jgi:RNA polymerase sigma-70 factor (ECF subfamily)